MKHFIFIASLFCTFTCAHSTLFAQKVLKDTKISFAWSNFGRVKGFLHTSPNKVEPDQQRAIMIEHYWRANKRFTVSTGFGYSRTVSNNPRSYDRRYLLRVPDGQFFGGPSYSYSTYRKHTIQIPLSVQYEALQFKSFGIYAHLTTIQSIAFYKRISNASQAKFEGRTMFTLDNIEINPGVGLRFWQFDLRWSYRYKNFSKKDELIFGTRRGSFDQKYDWYNIRKIWWTLGYRF